MNCREFRRIASLHRSGELAAAASRDADEHLKVCAECRAAQADADELQSLLERVTAPNDAEADRRLEGLDGRVLAERARRRTRAAELATRRGSPAFRLLRWSVAVNALAVGALAVACVVLALHFRSQDSAPGAAPAGLAPQSLRTVYQETRSLFGDRLAWVASTRGDVTMGIANAPDTGAVATMAVSAVQTPVTLRFALVLAGSGGSQAAGQESLILARPGSRIRYMVPGADERPAFEIAVDALERVEGAEYRIEASIAPASPTLAAGRRGEAISSLQVSASLAVGDTQTLGRVRQGGRFYDVTLRIEPSDSRGEPHGRV